MGSRGWIVVASLVWIGCGNASESPKPDPVATTESTATTLPMGKRRARPKDALPEPTTQAGDPRGGRFTLDDALAGLGGKGDPIARIETDLGVIECRLLPESAPIAVANFIGLARGLRPSWDGAGWSARRAYDGTRFHRIVKGFMIQGGSMGSADEAGYVIPDEPGGKHDHAGQLCMANRGRDTASKQFFITDGPAPHLDGGFTIFGECGPIDRIHEIASVPVVGERPQKPPVIERIRIVRGGDADPPLPASASAAASASPRASSSASARPKASGAP